MSSLRASPTGEQRMVQFSNSLDQYFQYLRCYPAPALARIKHDLCQALHSNPYLVPGYAPLRVPTPQTQRPSPPPTVVYLHGTLLVGGLQVPVHLYVPPPYPQHPPLCFVAPGKDMRIQAGPHLGDDGTFYHPILSQWNSNYVMTQVIGEMKNAFLQNSPLLPAQPTLLPDHWKKQLAQQLERETTQLAQQIQEEDREYAHSIDEDGAQSRELHEAEQTAAHLREQVASLRAWLESSHPETKDETVEEAPGQLEEVEALDKSYDDLLYHLRYLQQHNSEQFALPEALKTCRKIARLQFYQRALALKIRQSQLY